MLFHLCFFGYSYDPHLEDVDIQFHASSVYLINVRARDGADDIGDMSNSQFMEEKENMEESLRKYKELKEASRDASADSPFLNEESIDLLRQKNDALDDMKEAGASTEEIREAEKQAYKDAGLYQGND